MNNAGEGSLIFSLMYSPSEHKLAGCRKSPNFDFRGVTRGLHQALLVFSTIIFLPSIQHVQISIPANKRSRFV